MLRRTFAALLAALVFCGQAQALTPGQRVVLLSRLGAYVGPGDIASGWSAFYSCARAFSRAYASPGTNKACNLRNTSTNETCDELLTPQGAPGLMANCSGSSNGKTLAAFCACAVTKMYNQAGGLDISQATAANQPPLLLSCLNGLPCPQTTSSTIVLASASNFTPVTGVVTNYVIANRASGTNAATIVSENGIAGSNRIATLSGVTQWEQFGGSSGGVTSSGVANATWHVAIGIANGSSSRLTVDGVSTTGAATGGTTAAAIEIQGAAATTHDEPEFGFLDNVVGSNAMRTALCKNAQAAYGGGANFGAIC